jgi:hypothetical protein
MNKLAGLFFIVILFAACTRKPFVEHKVQFEKTADGCAAVPAAFKMNSGFGGERFEFYKCLATDFSKEQVTSERKGDTVVVHFKSVSESQSTFAITLDIDSYPKYKYITIDGDTYSIGPSDK